MKAADNEVKTAISAKSVLSDKIKEIKVSEAKMDQGIVSRDSTRVLDEIKG